MSTFTSQAVSVRVQWKVNGSSVIYYNESTFSMANIFAIGGLKQFVATAKEIVSSMPNVIEESVSVNIHT